MAETNKNERKITWCDIYKDFKKRHPNLKKEVAYWVPHDYATIKLKLKDGTSMLYNYDDHMAKFIKE